MSENGIFFSKKVGPNQAKFIVLGCPVADNEPPCPRCGGNWPGTRITTEALTRAVMRGTVVPEKLGCQPLADRAKAGLELVEKQILYVYCQIMCQAVLLQGNNGRRPGGYTPKPD